MYRAGLIFLFLLIVLNSINACQQCSSNLLSDDLRSSSSQTLEERYFFYSEKTQVQLFASFEDSLKIYNGNFEFPNSGGKSYFIGGSSIPLSKGEGYYQNILLSTNMVNFGISDNFSVGGGFDLISLFFGPTYFFTPRVGFEISENLYVGGGITAVAIMGEGINGSSGSDDIFSLGYGLLTMGSEEINISVGAGPMAWRLLNDMEIYPTALLSGYLRISNRIAIKAENYFTSIPNTLNHDKVIILNGIYGISLLSKKFFFDVGIANFTPKSYGGGSLIPYLSYVKKF